MKVQFNILLLGLGLLIQCNLLAQYSGGSGTESDPYQINSATDLLTLSNNSADWNGNHFAAGGG